MFSTIFILIFGFSVSNQQDIFENSLQQIQKPIFIKKPPKHLYVTPSKAALVECVAKQSSLLQINCLDDADTIAKTSTVSLLDQSKESFFFKKTKRTDKKEFDKISKSVQGDVHSVNLTLTEKTVESWFVRSFWCQCEAGFTHESSVTPQLEVTSKTYIEVAYIEKVFKLEPNSATLYLGRYVKLTCIPPDGNPKPKIYWRKNGNKLVLLDTTKVIVYEDGSLVIFSTSTNDNGLYECVAENEAGVRVSKAAKLEVLDSGTTDNGDWLPWAPWNACPTDCSYGKYCGNACIKYVRRRSRLCKSNKDKVKCPGSALQTESCATFCRVDGEWNVWSEWSTCQSDCSRKRNRECNNPKPQSGGEVCLPKSSFVEKENCTLDSCYRMETPLPQKQYVLRDMVVYVVLSIALFLLILVTLVILCLQKKQLLFTPRSPEMSSKISSDKGGFILLKSISDRTTLMKDNNSESAGTYNSSSVNNSSPLIKETNMKHDSSNSTICTSRYVENIPNTDVTSKSTVNSKQVLFQHPPISCHYKEVELPSSPILTNYNSLLYQPISTPVLLPPIEENLFINKNSLSNGSTSSILVTSSGGRVVLGSSGISVTIMPDSFKSDKPVSLELYTKFTNEKLAEFENHTQLSSIIFCNLSEPISLKKPLILVFPHCITWKSLSSWALKVVKLTKTFQWEIFVDLQNPQQSNKQVYCHLDEEFCYIMTYELFPFCLLGTSQSISLCDSKADKSDLSIPFPLPTVLANKRLCVISFLEPLLHQQKLQLSCYLFIDTKDMKDYLISKITAAGCRIFDIPHTLSLKESIDNVSVTVESASGCWKVHPVHKYQEIPFEDLWNFRIEPFITKNIVIEHSEITFQPFHGKITVYQNNFYQDRIEISISFNSTEITNSNKNCPPAVLFKDVVCKLIPASKTFRLPRVTIRDLSNHLDPPKIPVSQWIMIAKQLGISNNLEYFLKQSNPTAYLLMLWEAQNREETALVDLKSTLKIIGSLDIANVFK